jgi:hypothetical protein
MNNISFLNIILFAIFTIIMMMLLIFLVGVMNYKEIIRIVRNEKIEMFESKIILDKQLMERHLLMEASQMKTRIKEE